MKRRLVQIADSFTSTISFSRIGTNEDGVPSYIGTIPSLSACILRIIMGIVVAFILFAAWPDSSSNKHPIMLFGYRAAIFMCVLVPLGSTLGAGIKHLYLRKQFARLTPAEHVCTQMGVTSEEWKRMAEERGIKPCCIVNEEGYYDLVNWGNAATLLRASQQPIATPETLLRPAAYAETPQEQLLRIVSDE